MKKKIEPPKRWVIRTDDGCQKEVVFVEKPNGEVIFCDVIEPVQPESDSEKILA